MIWIAAAMGIVGLLLSAFFSGSEIGFYRMSRTRLMLDALGGDWIARGLLRLVNAPALFVATTLTGNNVANYLVSLAIVIVAGRAFGGGSAAELAAPLALAPVLFVYGELLPKYLFLQAPNRLLRLVGPVVFFFTILFLPVSLILWLFSRIVAGLAAESPERVTMNLARRELRRVLQEGHEAGLLLPAQQNLARGIFAKAQKTVGTLAVPLRGTPRARSDMNRDDILGLARRYAVAEIAVEEAATGTLCGYLRAVELAVCSPDQPLPLRKLQAFAENEISIVALMQLQSSGESMAEVLDGSGQTVGLLSVAALRKPFLHGA